MAEVTGTDDSTEAGYDDLATPGGYDGFTSDDPWHSDGQVAFDEDGSGLAAYADAHMQAGFDVPEETGWGDPAGSDAGFGGDAMPQDGFDAYDPSGLVMAAEQAYPTDMMQAEHQQQLEQGLEAMVEEAMPERLNLHFLAELRDRIEHRHLPALDEEIFGECQACLTNFEGLLVREFGNQFALNARRAFALQFGESLQSGQIEAIRGLQRKRAADVLDFIEEFRGRLPEQIAGSQRSAFRVYLLPKVGTRPSSSDAAVEFVKFDPSDAEQMEKYEQLKVLIRDRHVPVANSGMLKPSQVVAAVADEIPWRFTVNRHTRCWRHYGVRPRSGASDPTATKQQYCVWDEAHRDYLYMQAWVRSLTRRLREADEYQRAIGIDPQTQLGETR